MARTFSLDDNRVGNSSGSYFKVTGTAEKPQRIALIPKEITLEDMVITDQLKADAKSSDPKIAKLAKEKIEDRQFLSAQIQDGLKKKYKSSEVWKNESGQQVILFPRLAGGEVIWIEGPGYVYFKEGTPREAYDKDPLLMYGVVVIQYDIDDECEPKELKTPISLDNGDVLNFKYSLHTWTINDSKIRSWRKHNSQYPFISTDFKVWAVPQGKGERIEFSPCRDCFWRSNESIKRRVIKESRKIHEGLSNVIAKDWTLEEICQAAGIRTPGGGGSPDSTEEVDDTPIDFTKLLGNPEENEPAEKKESPKEEPLNIDSLLGSSTNSSTNNKDELVDFTKLVG